MFRNVKLLGLCVAALVAATTTPIASAEAQRWREQVDAQLLVNAVLLDAMQSGFSRTHETTYGLLGTSGRDLVTMRLVRGVSYRLMGKCDQDCHDLDLRVYDEYGDLIARDAASDDFPVVSIRPSRTATYTVQVAMAGCRTQVCGWGLAVIGR